MGKREFAERFIHLGGRLISFVDRPYLQAIYDEAVRNLVLRCSRQTEKSTMLVNTIIYEACRRAGVQMLFVCPREEQARLFSQTRLMPAIAQSPLVARLLLQGKTRLQDMNLQFANGSSLFLRAAFRSADACRGISAELLMMDEVQDASPDALPVLQETLSHARHGRTILTGTPKGIGNPLEIAFRQSTVNEWTLCCDGCDKRVILDQHSLGPSGVACPSCGGPLDPRAGHWVPRNPESTWGAGYWINHLMVPWVNFEEVLERQRSYNAPTFTNEVLGLPSTIGQYVVTMGELEKCCGSNPMARSRADVPAFYQPRLVGAIDWGGGSVSQTLLVVGYMDRDYCFHVVRFERFAAAEDPSYVLQSLAERCRQFGIQWLAADGQGNGHVYNRLLFDRVKPRRLYAICYSVADHEPRRDGVLMWWDVRRSDSIGVVMSRIKKEQICFPRIEDCGSYLDEFACEIAEYDSVNRCIKFSHPDSQQDDALHATNYALLLGTYMHQSARR